MSRFVVRDPFFTKAKKDGYRARSAYKLQEIQKRFKVVTRGNKVLDLGCAPGSFLQVLSELVGQDGLVLGIDLLPVAPLERPNVTAMVADIRAVDIGAFLQAHGIETVDVVTCDIAPNLSGIREVDDRNRADLFEAIRSIVLKALKPRGNFVFKSFFSEDLQGTTRDLNQLFTKVSLSKPAASRSVSSEIYLVCTGKKSN
jgi:23S rRNA (uridine2552-2'-O)-methyltransferase